MGLFPSKTTPRAVAALTQAGAEGLRLREIASATQSSETTLRHALQGLVGEGLVEQVGPGRGPGYRLRRSPATEALVRLVFAHRPRDEVLTALVRANRAVEFAALEDTPDPLLLVVSREGAKAADEVLLQRALGDAGIRARYVRHDDLIAAALEDEGLRQRLLAARHLKGHAARSLPDRRVRGDLGARPLHRPHPRLRRVSRRKLSELAHRYGVRRLSLFGSATRRDFGPDSDVDLLVEYERPPSLRELVDLELELERLVDRDVDLVREGELSPAARRRALAEAVPLLG